MTADALAQSFEASLGALDTLEALQPPSLEVRLGQPCSAPQEAQVPPPPRLFGRSDEAEAIVDTIARASPSYVAVLGGPGIGKTSLATSVLHAPSVLSRFGARRYFVALDAANGRSVCLGLICDAFGIAASSRQVAEKKLAAVLRDGLSLLVLVTSSLSGRRTRVGLMRRVLWHF